jgi:hypothetical protein
MRQSTIPKPVAPRGMWMPWLAIAWLSMVIIGAGTR